jgi:hypothetical protein
MEERQMACNCGGGAKVNRQQVEYEVKYRDGTKERFATAAIAQAAAGKRKGSMRVVAKQGA